MLSVPRRPEAIVIGASAGGVEAVGILLSTLTPAFDAAVIVVIHISAAKDNLLVDVLASRCALEVREACDKEPVSRATVYVAPPDYHLLVEPDRTLALSVDAPVRYSRPSIDVLFESAAHAYRERLLGIVLTGANDDGADGLVAIRALGGQAWVQQPETAAARLMPQSAIERAGADRIFTLDDMAAALSAPHLT